MEKRQEIGSPVRCGEGVSQDFLSKFGIEPNPLWIAAEIDGAKLISPAGHEFIVDQTLAGDEVGFVIERDLFDRDLAYMAAKAGADVVVKCTATELLREGGRISGVKVIHNGDEKIIKTNLIVGADGYESQIGRWAGIDTALKPEDIMSCVQYRLTGIDLNPKYVEFFIGSAALILGLTLKFVPNLLALRLLTLAQAADLNLMEDYRKSQALAHIDALWDRVYRYEASLCYTGAEKEAERDMIRDQRALLESTLARLPAETRAFLGNPDTDQLVDALWVTGLLGYSNGIDKRHECSSQFFKMCRPIFPLSNNNLVNIHIDQAPKSSDPLLNYAKS